MKLHFKSATIENVRCFGSRQKISFLDKEGNPSRWNLILGENGTGKTTVLKALITSLVYRGHVKSENVDLEEGYFIREKGVKAEIENVLVGFTGNQQHRDIMTLFLTTFLGPSKYVYSEGPLKEEQELIISQNLVLFAYGASRRIGNAGITGEKTSPVASLVDENAALTNAEEWLVQSEFLALKKQDKSGQYERVKTILLKLFRGEVHDIKIETNNNVQKKIDVLFKTDYGWAPIHHLSLGYKTLIAWLVDFARGMYERYPDSADPLGEPAICLVDEIDLHLHPQFQQQMIGFLNETFPQTQFIVTAHSPLIVQAAADANANVILLQKKGHEIKVVNDLEVVRTWRMDQILTSDLFGLKSDFSPESYKRIERRRKLLSVENLNPKEKAELESIEADFGILPPEESALGLRIQAHLKRLEREKNS